MDKLVLDPGLQGAPAELESVVPALVIERHAPRSEERRAQNPGQPGQRNGCVRPRMEPGARTAEDRGEGRPAERERAMAGSSGAQEGQPPASCGPRRSLLTPPGLHAAVRVKALGLAPPGSFPPSSLLFSFLSFSFSPWRPSFPFPKSDRPNTLMSPRRTPPQADQGPSCPPRAQLCWGLGLLDLGGAGKNILAVPGSSLPTPARSGLPHLTPGDTVSFCRQCSSCQALFVSSRTYASGDPLGGFQEAAFSAIKSHGRETIPHSKCYQSP